MLYRNPVIPGYNPDPSICRVGEDFYLVNSTFEFFPGVPIYHSKNLVNWELIGHCLPTKEHLYLEGCRNSGGIYAPTIRYHDGYFFMITTNVTHKGNFIVHAKDPRGPWSLPAWVDQDGIDPSLFWDDDGKCYYCSTGHLDGKSERAMPCFEINPFTGEILSEKFSLGLGDGGQCPEGPHIYKINGWYYFMLAEGGTEYGHRETIHRAKDIHGPYERCPHNPIICHRERKGDEIQATGHADLVQDQHGNWWMVCLGYRNFGHALLHNLGRETFLTPVTWTQDGWPVVGKGGYTELEIDAPLPAPVLPVDHSVHLDLKTAPINPHFVYTRNPNFDDYQLDTQNGALTLIGHDVTISQPAAAPTVLSVRQPAFCTRVVSKIDAAQTDAARAGISAYYNNDYHYDIYLSRAGGQLFVGFTKALHDMTVELVRTPVDADGEIALCITSDREKYTFSYIVNGVETVIGSGLNAGLSTEGTKTMTFTGTFFSMFCEDGRAVFKSFDLDILPDPGKPVRKK